MVAGHLEVFGPMQSDGGVRDLICSGINRTKDIVTYHPVAHFGNVQASCIDGIETPVKIISFDSDVIIASAAGRHHHTGRGGGNAAAGNSVACCAIDDRPFNTDILTMFCEPDGRRRIRRTDRRGIDNDESGSRVVDTVDGYMSRRFEFKLNTAVMLEGPITVG
jgi:hypothetical protein